MSRELDRILPAAMERAVAGGRSHLDEVASFAIAAAVGLAVPLRAPVAGPGDAEELDLEDFPGDRLVVKVRSPEIAHKADEGGVVICERSGAALGEAVGSMQRRLAGLRVDGFSVHEHIGYDASLGGELLLGVRWSNEFGPVAVLGLGGVEVERLASRGGWEPIVMSRVLGTEGARLPTGSPLVELLTEPYRGRAPRAKKEQLELLIERLLEVGERWMDPRLEQRLTDFEVNPIALSADGAVALDALARVTAGTVAVAPARPVDKLESLLEPQSIAVAGVSRRMNIGRIILQNVLRQGFAKERIRVIKPGTDEIDGCQCVDTFSALPQAVDLAVLAVAAGQLPEIVDEIVARRRAESMILIPGGLGELEGSEEHAARIARTLTASRESEGGGPIANGGNCLGVRSLRGGYDTLFIPGHKLVFPQGEGTPLALLTQSGAFAIARASKLSMLNPRYVVTFGNQIDLTLADYLEHLEKDPEIAVFACYVEGFRALDGRRFLEISRRITDSGRTVVFYRAGRTRAGATAAASHTASVAGSYTLTRELAARAGALVAESIEEFEDLVRTFSLLHGRAISGRRLAAMSNAGFESVAMGDNLGELELAKLSAGTVRHLEEILTAHRLETIVAARNPLDLTPVVGDEGFAAAARALVKDSEVDLAIIGCVPLTPALQTLSTGVKHDEDYESADAIGRRLIRIWNESTKPWVMVVDSGPLYDPLTRMLEESGIPTFRSADRALSALNRWAMAVLAAA